MTSALSTIDQTTSVSAAEAERVKSYPASWLETACWIVAVLLGLLQAWANRHSMDPDGISYLDMGDAYLRGDWPMAVNAFWSPLYPWLLGLALWIVQPSPYWEFTVVHLVNFAIYLSALGCFAFFLRELIRYQRAQVAGLSGGGLMNLPEWAWVALGYTLFVWSSLNVASITKVTPDMCVAAFVYLACGIILRVRRGGAGWPTFLCLGLVLGLGYLAKAAMFPLAFIFLGVSLFATGNLRKGASRTAAALIGFFLMAGPLIIALSGTKGRLTFGENGRLNYAWHVNGFPRFTHWQGEPAGSGVPKHPTRKIFGDPPVYEFGTPVGGTYPPWYDPSYWYEGMTPRFDLSQQIKPIMWAAKIYYSMIFALHGSLLIGLFILLYMSGRGRLIVKDIAGYWFLLIPALAAFGMYSLVWLETRYIAPFFVLLIVGLFSGVRLPDSQESRRLIACVAAAVVATFVLWIGPASARAAYTAVHEVVEGGDPAPHLHWQVADGLKRMGMQPGDKVGYIGEDFAFFAFWARLARVQIIADLPARKDFWAADASIRNRIIEAFKRTEAKLIVADEAPPGASAQGWKRIGSTDHHVYFLSR